MSLTIVNGMLQISCGMTMTAALASAFLLAGFRIKEKLPFMRKYCVPAHAIGGFLFMFLAFAGYKTGLLAFDFDLTLQEIFMMAFFTTVGLGVTISLLKSGGLLLIVYWLCASVISIIQNIISVSLASATGLEYPYALLAGAISMIGGHSAAHSYGEAFVEMGYPAAATAGASAATFGLVLSIIIGGPMARFLIERHHLAPEDPEGTLEFTFGANPWHGEKLPTGERLSHVDVLKNVTVILICMTVGEKISDGINSIITMGFPPYVGAMLVAILARNLNDKFHLYHFNLRLVDGIGDIMLHLYLSMALMSISLYQLFDLARPVLLIVAVQTLVLFLLCYLVIFRILGGNYDAAVMCAGMIGHGIGATPSAIVNMTVVRGQYGMSRKAFMIVPIVGAFLVDIIYQPQTIAFIRFFVRGTLGM